MMYGLGDGWTSGDSWVEKFLAPNVDSDKEEWSKPVPLCRHYGEAVALPNGNIVHCSSHHTVKHIVPDYGFYFDGCWKPETIAWHIGWDDYSIPSPPIQPISTIAPFSIWSNAISTNCAT